MPLDMAHTLPIDQLVAFFAPPCHRGDTMLVGEDGSHALEDEVVIYWTLGRYLSLNETGSGIRTSDLWMYGCWLGIGIHDCGI